MNIEELIQHRDELIDKKKSLQNVIKEMAATPHEGLTPYQLDEFDIKYRKVLWKISKMRHEIYNINKKLSKWKNLPQ